MIDKRYNKKLRKIITLEKGERFCPKCNGNGILKRTRGRFRSKNLMCSICLGAGKLDWIEDIRGKKNE